MKTDKHNKIKLFSKKKSVDDIHYEHIPTIEAPTSPISEAYRRIKVGLEYSDVDRKLKVIQVCSSIQSEGKTTTLINLAVAHSDNNQKVIVVDLDFRRSTLHKPFKVENKNGLVDVLAGKVSLDEAIKHSSDLPFDLLNRGSKPPYPQAILASKEIEHLFEELKEKYDYILVDCPPILAVSDAVIISRLTDGVLFVVSQPDTDKNEAKAAVKELKNNKVNILGCVVTGLETKGSGYGYNYKYNYYYHHDYNYKEN